MELHFQIWLESSWVDDMKNKLQQIKQHNPQFDSIDDNDIDNASSNPLKKLSIIMLLTNALKEIKFGNMEISRDHVSRQYKNIRDDAVRKAIESGRGGNTGEQKLKIKDEQN